MKEIHIAVVWDWRLFLKVHSQVQNAAENRRQIGDRTVVNCMLHGLVAPILYGGIWPKPLADDV